MPPKPKTAIRLEHLELLAEIQREADAVIPYRIPPRFHEIENLWHLELDSDGYGEVTTRYNGEVIHNFTPVAPAAG